MQSYEIEYLVSNLLDGTTPSPAFIPVDQAPSQPIVPEDLEDLVVDPDDDNIYRFEVTNLGLIDPDFGLGGTFADRFVVGFWIDAPAGVSGDATSTIGILSTREREIVQEFVVPSLLGISNFYRKECIFVPQGSLVGVTGFDASANADPIVVRLHIKQAETLEEYALLLESCCCSLATVCETPEVTQATPTSITCTDPELLRTVTVTGGPFNENTTVELINVSCVGGSVSISDLQINSETELQFVVNCDTDCTFGIRISNGAGCDIDVDPPFTTSGGG